MTNDISSVAEALTELLKTTRSHSASEPDVSDGGFVARTLRGLNPGLKTLLDALRRSPSDDGRNILRAHSGTVQDVLNLDRSNLREAHKALTRSRGLIFVDEPAKQLLTLINDGDTFFARVGAIIKCLNEWTSPPSIDPEATKDTSS